MFRAPSGLENEAERPRQLPLRDAAEVDGVGVAAGGAGAGDHQLVGDEPEEPGAGDPAAEPAGRDEDVLVAVAGDVGERERVAVTELDLKRAGRRAIRRGCRP